MPVDFDQIEEELIKEEQEKHKEKMPVSGRSVFEILRLKKTKHRTKESENLKK